MCGGKVISIGSFDGVHLGHAALVRAARRLVGASGTVRIMAFDPHPAATLRPESTPTRLSTFEQRGRWLRAAGADEVVLIRPGAETLALCPEAFVRRLVTEERPRAIVEGPDFRFGAGRTGDVETLRRLGREHGFDVLTVEPVAAPLDDQALVTVSSSMIRWLVGRGRMRDAACLLGRPYELECAVVRGDQRGRLIGFPTANLASEERQLPGDGIYAGWATLPDGARRLAAISVGTKPTFGVRERVCEAHLLDYDAPVDEYEWTIRLEVHDWMRDQLRCSDAQDLSRRIGRDVATVRELLGTAVGRCP